MNALKGLWAWFWQPSSRYALGVLLIVGLVAGAGGVVVFGAVLDKTNSLEFCTGCHEMAGAPLEEYKKSVHYQNAKGIRAACPDCHVPHSGVPKLMAKFAAAKDVWGTLTGSINTPEKYEALRGHMAEGVWAKMRANDSRECRSCHSFSAMMFDKQDKSGAKKHQKTMQDTSADRKTCIDCHKGVAHKAPNDAS